MSAVRIFEDLEALARYAAEWLCALAEASGERFAICLCGGSTPRRLYENLAHPALAARFPWRRTHWFWGDERFVPHDDPASNYGMARAALFSHVAVPQAQLHPIPTEGLSPDEAAAAYERTLADFYGGQALDPGRPIFDATLLGIGEDGHTASLFPGNAALAEDRRWVRAVVGAKPEPRITLTYPALDSSREVAFLAAGAAKRDVVRRARAHDPALPAGRVRPVGKLHWLIDEAASPAP